ncbi:helix-turn-helix domain-containing protein [Sphaerisporangium sp. NPDC005289]|uniref:winged helix-turn-helix transcriptional regulator n=1 Tax=Sphaerisporangium sp. NPDC005289 TaxID=3155247 RepID=UPI0033A7685B
MVESPVIPGRPCSIAATLHVAGDRWSLLAMREILFGNRRFSQIARNTGAPRDRLAVRLKSLVAEGILEKREYQATRFEYHFTDAGKDLLTVLISLMTWGDRWVADDPPMILEHHGHRIQPAMVCRTCGQGVGGNDLHLVSHAPGWTMSGPDTHKDTLQPS